MHTTNALRVVNHTIAEGPCDDIRTGEGSDDAAGPDSERLKGQVTAYGVERTGDLRLCTMNFCRGCSRASIEFEAGTVQVK